MSKRLTGLNPLAYMGVEPQMPPNMYMSPSAPTPTDVQNFNLGDFWVDTTTQTLYVLVSQQRGIAAWITTFGGATTEFATDSGTAMDSAGVIRIIGDSSAINTTGSGNTVQINFDTNATIDNLRINGNLDVIGTSQLHATQLVGQIDGVLVTDGSGNVSATHGTNGQLLISGGTAPAWANITSTGGSITITNGANTINLEAPTATGLTTIHTNSGDVTQSAGAVTLHGDGTTLQVTGSSHTGTIALVNGTAGQLLVGGGAAPAWANLTSMGATVVITNGANSINLEATGGGSSGASTFITDSGNALENLGDITIAGGHNISTSGAGQTVTINVSGTTNHALQLGNSTGSLTSLAVATNGQLPIGSTGANPVLSTLTAGSGINITNGAGSITVSATGGGGGGGTTITTFSTPGTYSFEKGLSTKYIEVWGWCAGGGAGSGQSASGLSQGGAGGGSGSFFRFKGPAAFFGASETVVVGAGGTGGASTSSGIGNSGTNGGVSSFGNIVPPLTVNNYAPGATITSLPQFGAGGGDSLQISPGCGYGGGVFTDDANFSYKFNGSLNLFNVPVAGQSYTAISPHTHNGGASSFTVGQDGYYTGGDGINGTGGYPFLFMVGTSGAQGGSIQSGTSYSGGAGGQIYALDGSTIINAGGIAGIAGGFTFGGAGNDKPTSGGIVVGGSGGGGGAADAIAPGDGGNGGLPGGGGGGGGATTLGHSSGAGGNGGDGLILVIEWT